MMGKRELVALLNLSSWCLVMVERLFLAVPQGCLWFVIVVFPDHTHLLFLLSSPILWQKKRQYVTAYVLNVLYKIILCRLGVDILHTKRKTDETIFYFIFGPNKGEIISVLLSLIHQ